MSLRATLSAVVFILLAAGGQTSLAENKCAEKLSSVTPSYTQKLVQFNRFTTWRDLQEYLRELKEPFEHALAGLRADSVWLDAGAGLARAQLDYLLSKGALAAKLIAASISYPKYRPQMAEEFDYQEYRKNFKSAVANGNLRYVEADVADLPDKHALAGSVDLITDLYGPATYSDFTQILAAYGHMLKPGGIAIINLPALRLVRPNGSTPTHDEPIPLSDLVKEIKGFQIELVGWEKWPLLVLKRTTAPLSIPTLLTRGSEFGAWGEDYLTLEWIRTKKDWDYSWFNPRSARYAGMPLPIGFAAYLQSLP